MENHFRSFKDDKLEAIHIKFEEFPEICSIFSVSSELKWL